MSGTVDVVVAGGGPAGAAVALTLLGRTRLTVAVVERSDYAAPRVGETLSPGARGLLGYLGVWEGFRAAGHRPSLGTSAAWGGPEVATRDFLFSPYGPGWHLDRRRFDAGLAGAVEAAGGAVWRRTRIDRVDRAAGGGWRLGLRGAGGRHRVTARFLVDATGRTASLARRLGARRVALDGLVGVTGVLGFPAFPAAAPGDAFTLVEAVETGWWYSAPLPGGELAVALMSDGDLIHAGGRAREDAWRRALAATGPTAERARGGTPVRPLAVGSARGGRLDPVAGDGWAAVGDAAASHDPLSASGIARALDSGARAAVAIHARLERGDEAPLAAYAERQRRDFEVYCDTWARYYQIEQRWPGAPFWRRRHHRVTLDPAARLVLAAPLTDVDLAPTEAAGPGAEEARLVCRLCAGAPRPAHEIVRELQRLAPRPPVAEDAIAGLQRLVARGVLRIAA